MVNSVTIEVLDQQVQDALNKLQAQAGSIAPALKVVGRTVQTRITMGFRNGVSPYGQVWSPLKIRNGQPLRDTSRLQRSIVYQVGGTGLNQYVDIGTSLIYAPVHQYGAVIKAKTAKMLRFMGSNGPVFKKAVYVPDRPFMPIQGDSFVLPPAWGKAVLLALRNHFERVTA